MGSPARRAADAELGGAGARRAALALSALVVDSSLVVWAISAGDDLTGLGARRLLGPPLLWSEVTSVLHEARWRGQITAADAEQARRALAALPVERDAPDDLLARAWEVADELGWAKTYDAEFLALARLRGCRVVTLDARLRRSAGATGLVVGPTELGR